METKNGRSGPSSSSTPPTKQRTEVDWSRYGLSETSTYQASSKAEFLYTTEDKEEAKELFEQEQEQSGNSNEQEPWWKTSFFVTRKLFFGTWDGVFTSCIMNMVGVVLFLRSGWMVGYAGIGLSLLIVLITFLVALATIMSAVGICDRCHIGKGGVYFIITHVLGGKIGGAIGLLYCIGHATATALYCTGFAESLVELLQWKNSWAIRIVSMVTMLVLLGISLSGVKWIIRFQLVLIVILGVAMFDYIIGTLAHVKPDDGFTGFSNYNFEENLKSEFTDDITFFVVLGVFFPTACGVLAGVNMSGDLKEPAQNIPEGSVAALGLCGGIYTLIVLFLGSTCTREALKTDYMIMEKVSLVGGLFLFGLYVASLSSSLGGLAGPPRVLQSIAADDVLPVLKPFAKVHGATEEPRNATLIVALIAFLFIFVGNLNALAPIVTMPFLMTYTAINYSYFAMAMSFDIKQKNLADESKAEETKSNSQEPVVNGYGSLQNDTNDKETDVNKNQTPPYSFDIFESGMASSVGSNQSEERSPKVVIHPTLAHQDSTTMHIKWIEEKHSSELYAKLCNRWISLAATVTCLILSFCISWVYSLANICVTLLIYIFICHTRPGLTPGVSSDFNFGHWLYNVLSRKNIQNKNSEHVIIQPNHVPFGISMYQVTQDNSDYEHRDRKHLASLNNKPVPYN